MDALQKSMSEFLQTQQELMRKNQEAFLLQLAGQFKDTNPKTTDSEFRMEALANGITEFIYNEEEGNTFDSWYSRYETIFTEDAQHLTDEAKVRLLLRKLSTSTHQQYIDYILPNEAKSLTFKNTVETLTEMFGAKITLFNRRYQCMKLVKQSSENFIAYAANVNKVCEKFQISTIKPNEFKALIFVCGLQSSNDADIRTRLLNSIENSPDVTLQQLTTECQRLINLKKDTALVGGNQNRNSSVNAVSQDKQNTKKATPKSACWYCGGMHYSNKCTYKHYQCKQCNKTGHKEGFCNSKNQRKNFRGNKKFSSTKSISIVKEINSRPTRKFVTVYINGTATKLQIDTASDITIISQKTWEQLGKPYCQSTDHSAQNASGSTLELSGEFQCNMTLRDQSHSGTCYVTPLNHLNVLGIDWITRFGLWDIPLNTICKQISTGAETNSSNEQLKSIIAAFPDVFNDSLGHCRKSKVQLFLKPESQPVFRPKRPVAYAAIEQVDEELHRLQNLNIITPVDHSDWAAPIVVVKKSTGKVRICADYSTGLNEALEPHRYPLPLPEDIFAKLANSKKFSVIDLSDAFLQVEVAEESRKFLTINTHKGLFQFNRLPFGVKAAPGAFQQIMDQLTAGLDGTSAYLDDILVSGQDEELHLQNLLNVLERIRDFGFHLKQEKCKFFMDKLQYLGHIIDCNGIRPDLSKIETITRMPPPSDIATLRSYLGAITYYGKFVENMHTLRKPLDDLLKKDSKWKWSQACQQSFDKFKLILQSDLLLTHYDPTKKIIVAADASNTGIGACILHEFNNGSVKAIQHAARSLTAAERNYSQIEKEGLALTFAVTKFYRMIYGRRFVLQTDHKPLLSIFGPKKGVPAYSANRLQRWALLLRSYNFDIKYISTKEFGHADILSRLINTSIQLEEDVVIASIQNDVNQILENTIGQLPITFEMAIQETKKDLQLQTIMGYIQGNWPHSSIDMDSEMKMFFARKNQLSIVKECIMYDDRLVVPSTFHKRILHQLHTGHPGQNRMKSIARSYVYWPGMDQAITKYVRNCTSCAETVASPTKVNLQSWSTPSGPWQRLHIDYAGPVNGEYFLIVVDAFSKWPEIFQTKTITSEYTIGALDELISRFGIPTTIVSDNGTQFTSEIFKQFCNVHGITHMRTAPFHPQSNGQAERFVGTFKQALKKFKKGGPPLKEQLQTFLLMYRTSPNVAAPEGKSPAELLQGRKFRTKLNLLLPADSSTLEKSTIALKQEQQFNKKHGTRDRCYVQGEEVYVKSYKPNGFSWIPGVVIKPIGRVMYEVLTTRNVKVHANQMKRRYTQNTTDQHQLPLDVLRENYGFVRPQNAADVPEEQLIEVANLPRQEVPEAANLRIPEIVQTRSSSRQRKRPKHLQDYVQTISGEVLGIQPESGPVDKCHSAQGSRRTTNDISLDK